jgi:chromosome segregation ATPase
MFIFKYKNIVITDTALDEWYINIINILAVLVPVLSSLGGISYWLEKKFTEIDQKFEDIDQRFRHIEERFKAIDQRFIEIDERFKKIDQRFEELNKRIDVIERDLNDLRRYVDQRLVSLERHIDTRLSRLGEAFRSYQEFFIEYLATQGFLKPLEASMLKNEASRFIKLAFMNPLSKDELRRIKELLDKDELTLEEALELRELARKVTDEYGDRPEAWKLHIYASIMVGYALRKMKEKEEKEKR